MSKLHIVLDGASAHDHVVVYGKKREITPFIGVIKREDGSFTRGVGAKCPNQGKLVFVAVESEDPLHYLRACKMLEELWELSDDLAKDCVIATKDEHRLENFAQTKVYENSGEHRKTKFEDAQKKALAFKPSLGAIKQVIDEFALHLGPIAEKDPAGSTTNNAKSSAVVQFEQLEAMTTKADRLCYKPLVHALESPAHSAMPSAA